MLNQGSTADMVVNRGGKTINLPGVKFDMVSDGNGGKVMQQDFYVEPLPKTVFNVVRHAFYWTLSMVKLVWVTFIGLFQGRFGLKDLAGPVGTTVAMGQAASQGITSLLYLVAMISINLGVVNLFPLPALDGGRLIFIIIEGIRRKPVNPKYEGYVHFAGFVLLMLLMLVVTYNDILRSVKG
jgi:regulator of sigma E protease